MASNIPPLPEGFTLDAPQPDVGASLLESARKQYPYIKNANLSAVYSEGQGGSRKLEYWPSGEPGNEQSPRPSSIPIDKAGVQIFSADTKPSDIVADYVSHEAVKTDPKLRTLYDEFAASVPESTMKARYAEHRKQFGEKRPYQQWKESTGLPEFFRGYTFDQWPNASKYYTPEQLKKLDAVKSYLSTDASSQEMIPPLQEGFVLDPAAASPATEPVPTGPTDDRPTGDLVDAVNESAMVLGSGAFATPIAGIAGLGAAAARGLGLTDASPGDVVERVQGALTYEPRTKAGAVGARVVAYPFEKLAQGADWLGQQAADATDSPAIGAAVNTAAQVLAPAAIVKGVKGTTARVDGNRGTSSVDRPVASREAAAVTQTAPAAGRAPGLEGLPENARAQVEYVAPELVLEQTTRAGARSAQPAKPTPVPPEILAAQERAQKYVTSAGVDWAALPGEIQATLTNIAKDAKGLEGLDDASIARQLLLQSLPKPVPATRGHVTRDPVQLRNESNVSATEAGKPIREIYLDANQALLENLDLLKGRVANRSAAAQTPEAVGISVQDQALRAKLALKKKEVSAKYKAAEEAGELQGKVSPKTLIQTISNAVDKTQYGWVQTWLNANGVVTKTPTGTVTRKLTLKEMEALRSEAVAKAMDGGTEGYHAGKIIAAIDQATEGAGGKLYKEARAARRAQALEFEETGAVARLVDNKSRTDRAVALEDTWRKTVIGGSIQDLRNVKRSLLTGGDASTRTAGRVAWRDIKAQTIQHIKDEATKGVALNERGQPNITPAAMKRAIDSVGKEKLDEIFGQGTAERIDRILEATRIVKTVPPAGHAGSSTMSNVLSFLEKGLGKIPVLGNTASGAIRAGVKLNEMGAAGKVVRESQNLPLKPTAPAKPPPPPQQF